MNRLTCFFVFLFLFSCRRYHTQQPASDAPDLDKLKAEALIRVNTKLVKDDAITMDSFARHKGWQMNTTESGLRYMIYRRGNGRQAVAGQVDTQDYTLELLDSTPCYSSSLLGEKSFRIGQGGVEAGLEEGILLLHEGDKARLLLPPYLAHGLTGDGNCIPPRAILLYDVELKRLQ
jgi:FKBP-type peptidyl-prolyl cis-trans isomerase